jgi:hypothetical protein
MFQNDGEGKESFTGRRKKVKERREKENEKVLQCVEYKCFVRNIITSRLW